MNTKMFLSNLFRIVRRFYFNYHYPESSSVWIPSTFIRNIQYGTKVMISFLLVGFLSYGTNLSNHLYLEYLVPVISIICFQQTVGSTFFCCYQLTLAITPLSIFLFVAQKIGLGYHDYLATELLLLFTTFCIGFACSQVQTKKLCMLYNVLYFTSIFSQEDIPLTFAFQLFSVYLIGMGMTLIVSLLFFPLFATFDIENRFNYSLSKLQQMHILTIQAFLSPDKMTAHMFLAKVIMIESLVQKALNPLPVRLDEAKYEPSRLLKRIINRKHRHIINLTLKEQEDFITCLLVHIGSLQLMVKSCSFNDYHHDFVRELETSLLHVSEYQSIVISSLISPASVIKDEFFQQITNLQEAFYSLRKAYIAARLHRVRHVIEFASTIQLEDHLSHAFFLFQLETIIELLKRIMTITNCENKIPKKKDKLHIPIIQRLGLTWPRLFSSLKSMIIVGVGSIFVLVPRLANIFENGIWILVTLCMTQGDTVGGAFTTMKMRLIGTLLGAIWAYVTYLSVGDDPYKTLAMLSPWVLLFGYLKLLPNWGYTATVAAFTPVLINLGRLPYGSSLPAGNFALLRIEESFVGISIAIVLTILIFPTFAIDLLRDNIQNTLRLCLKNIISMHSIYDQLFHHNHSRESITYLQLEERKIESFMDSQRSQFHRLINVQRMLVEHASLEPTLWWINNAFSTKRYKTLVEYEIYTFQMLHNIDATLMKINEYSETLPVLQLSAAGGNFLPKLHRELSDLSRQLGDCLRLWISYFIKTQTRAYRLFRQCTYSYKEKTEIDFVKDQQYLIDLHRTVRSLQVQHQQELNRLIEHYLSRLAEGENYSTFIPYINNDEADSVFIAYYAMYYSTTQLAQTALALGETIHTILELETTRLYRPF